MHAIVKRHTRLYARHCHSPGLGFRVRLHDIHVSFFRTRGVGSAVHVCSVSASACCRYYRVSIGATTVAPSSVLNSAVAPASTATTETRHPAIAGATSADPCANGTCRTTKTPPPLLLRQRYPPARLHYYCGSVTLLPASTTTVAVLSACPPPLRTGVFKYHL